MRTIYFWPDGCWCEADGLESMLACRSDDVGSLRVSDEESDKGIDELVWSALLD